MKKAERERRAVEIFRQAGGLLRTSEALRHGIHRRELYGLRDSGVLEHLTRGVYRLADFPLSAQFGIMTVAKRVPKAVLALASALYFHDIGTQLPRAVQIALPRGSCRPRLDWPPIRVYNMSEATFSAGIETHSVDGVEVRVYSAAKTVADCFKFRNQIGLDVALEAMWGGWRQRKYTMDQICEFGRICRVENVMRPYLEAMVG